MDFNKLKEKQNIYKILRGRELHGMEKEIKEIDGFLNNLVLNSTLITFVPGRKIMEVINSGEYTSMQKLGLEENRTSANARNNSSEVLFGSKARDDDDYPKYGILSDKDILHEILVDGNAVYQYGSVIIVWKKEKVLNRTTMTIGNSINFGAYATKCPSFLSNPSYISIPGTNYYSPHQLADTRESIKSFYEKIKSGELTLFPSSIATSYNGDNGFEYYEIQLHGKLSIKDDVEEIDYFCGYEEDEKDFFNKLKAETDKIGIKTNTLTI